MCLNSIFQSATQACKNSVQNTRCRRVWWVELCIMHSFPPKISSIFEIVFVSDNWDYCQGCGNWLEKLNLAKWIDDGVSIVCLKYRKVILRCRVDTSISSSWIFISGHRKADQLWQTLTLLGMMTSFSWNGTVCLCLVCKWYTSLFLSMA
jgi:hypothetical protein